MSARQHMRFRSLEGRTVCLALADGSRLDCVSLVSARSGTIWVFHGGEDSFIPMDDVVDAWEAEAHRRAA